MALIPAYCPTCEIAFESNGICISNSLNITISGGGTNCPKCGGIAPWTSGTFNERGRGLEVVSGPPLTHLIVAVFADIAKRADSGEISERQALSEAIKAAPELAPIFERFSNRQISVAALLFTIMALLQQCVGSISDSKFQSDLIERLDKQIELMEHHGSNRGSNFSDKNARDKVHTGSTEKTNPKGTVVKTAKKSDRRVKVNKARREALKQRRTELNPK